MEERQKWYRYTVFVLLDLLALILSFVISYLLKFRTLRPAGSEYWLALLVTVCLVNLVINLLIDPYKDMFHRPFFEELYRGFVRILLNLAVTSFLLYLTKLGAEFSRSVVFWTYIIFYFVSSAVKYGWKRLVLSEKIRAFSPELISLMIVCPADEMEQTCHHALAADVVVYDIRAIFLPDGIGEAGDWKGIPILSGDMDWAGYAIAHNVEEVLISVPPECFERDSYESLLANGIRVHLNIEPMVGFETEEQRVSQVGIYKALSLDSFSFSASQLSYLGLKRILDILFGLVGCLLLVPISLLVKLVNLFSGDTAPIFYTQTRIGRHGKKFKLYKFRTMVPDADAVLERMLQEENYRKEWDKNQKFDNDPRITRPGHFLRRTSVDELPQMLNVLVGNMSLVGPRPLVEGELERHGGLKLYYKVKPGITGWWGCNGRSNIDYRERLDLEYYYIKHCSLQLDVICVLRTLFTVLKREGAR